MVFEEQTENQTDSGPLDDRAADPPDVVYGDRTADPRMARSRDVRTGGLSSA